MSSDPSLTEAARYLQERGAAPEEENARLADKLLHRIGKFKDITSTTEILEVGTGTGWFLVSCAQRGFRCNGVELNPLFVRHAVDLAREHGVEANITQGSVEDVDLGREVYDVIVATSVFEHVEDSGGGSPTSMTP